MAEAQQQLPAGIHVTDGNEETRELYVTFGSQYSREEHPSGWWPHPDGWLTVVFGVGRDGIRASRERARLAVWQWLNGGQYAFDYDELPSELLYPRGELARMVLP